MPEPQESFGLTLSAPTNAVLADDTATGTIIDDDRHREISVADATAAEGEVLDFVVTLDEPTSLSATVDYATSDGTAGAGEDYAPAQGTLTFPAGGTRGTVSVALTEDDAPEPEESFRLTLSAPTNAVLADDTATGTIIDDDRHREISVADATAAEGEVLDFVVTLDEPTPVPATVDYATSDGTARAGDDYAPAQGTLTFPAGGTRGTVSVALTEDDAPEPEESFGLTLSAPTNAVLADDTATGTIIDDDRHREISVADATAAEGEVLDFVVTLDEPTSLPATVDYATSDGTARAGEDYAPAQGTLTFPAGGTRGTVSVALTEDDVPEPEESFGLTLSAPTNAVLADDTATGTIIDDDRHREISVADATAAEGEVLDFVVTLDEPTSLPATVDYATSDGTARAGDDYAPAQGTLTFPAGGTRGTVSVALTEDDVPEPEESFGLTLSAPTNAVLADDTATGTIIDDDRLSVLAIADASATEGAGELSFAVTLDAATRSAVTVAYATADGTATQGEDYEAGAGILTFAPGELVQAIRVPVFDDTADEADETFALVLTDPGGATLGDGEATGTIEDDDEPPALSIADGSAGEGDGELALAVVLDRAQTVAVTAAYMTADGTAAAGEDYEQQSGTLTFAPGETERTVRVALLDDAAHEADETFAVHLAAPRGATIDDGEATGAIIDDDAPPALSIADASGEEAAGELAFAVVLDAASGVEATVAYATSDGTATAGEDYASAAGTLTFAPGETEKAVRVAVVDDAAAEPDEETFAVTLAGPEGATLADGEATGTIRDDDLVPPMAGGRLPTAMLCVGGADFELDLADYFDGMELRFSAVSSAPGIATAALAGSRLTVAPVSIGESEVAVSATNPAGSASVALAVRVVADPAELAAIDAVLASLGRGVLASVADAVGDRFAEAARRAPRETSAYASPGPSPPAAGNAVNWSRYGFDRAGLAGFAGEAGSAGPLAMGRDPPPPPFGTRRPPVAFSLQASAGGPGPAWTVWGRADTRRFESGLDGTSHRGTLTGMHVGADAGTDDWLAGVSVLRTEADADYRFQRSVDACGGGTGEGLLRADLTSIHPYAGRALGRGWVWLALGAGEGEVVVERCESGRIAAADLSTRLAALGGRHPIARGERLAVSVVEELGVLRLSTGNAAPPVGGRSVTVGQARLGLELAGVAPVDCACSLATFVRALARRDWGDGATGTGLELAAGVRYRNQPRRLGVDAGIRALALHSADGVRDRAANLALWFLPKADGTGWHGTLSLRRDPGRPGPDLAGNAPWTGHSGIGSPDAPDRWLAGTRIGYAIARRRGTATPFLELDAGPAAGGGRLGVRHVFGGIIVEWGIGRLADDRWRSGNQFVLTADGRF